MIRFINFFVNFENLIKKKKKNRYKIDENPISDEYFVRRSEAFL